ncbi:MAG: GIN domain-containing protein [Bernardetiaceae bacterium]
MQFFPKKWWVFIGLMFSLLGGTGCDGLVRELDCLYPKGSRIEKDYPPLLPFSELWVSGDFEVFLRQGEGYSLRVKGSPNIIQNLEIVQTADKLTLRPESCVHHSGRLYLFIEVPDLTLVRLEESTYLTGDSLNFEQLNIQIYDNASADVGLQGQRLDSYVGQQGHLCLRGSVEEHYVQVQGKGAVFANALTTQQTGIFMEGGTMATVYARLYLEAALRDSSTVFYGGNPIDLKQRIGAGAQFFKVE